MRILFVGNTVFGHTGYATQLKNISTICRELGHELIYAPFYGLEGGGIVIDGIPHLPPWRSTWGDDIIGEHVKMADPDVVINLHDIWVLPQDYRQRLDRPWISLFPVDSEPAAPGTVKIARTVDYPVCYSKFGQVQMKKAGVECDYIPHCCFDYDAPVQVSPTRIESLGDIATERVQVGTVLGLDRGVVRPVRILKRFVLPHRDNVAVKIRTSGGRAVIATRDNGILTPQGWRPAGDLNIGDYVCTLGIYGHTRQASYSLDARRVEPIDSDVSGGNAGESNNNVSKRLAGNPSEGLVSGFAPYSSCGSQAKPSVPLRPNSTGTSLHCGDDRRRGAHFNDRRPPQETKSYVDSSRSCDYESIRGPNSVAHPPHLLVASVHKARYERAQLGIQANNFWPPNVDIVATATTLPGNQAASGGNRHRVCSETVSERNFRALQHQGLGSTSGSSTIEQQEILTHDRIVAIEFICLDTVYDISTECGNFLVDGIVVHNCNTDVFKPGDKQAARRELGLPADKFICLMVGANKGYPSRKAFPEQLAAFAAFHKTHPDTVLYLHTTLTPVGHPNDGVDLRAILHDLGVPASAVLNTSEHALCLGVPETFLASLYQSADVLLHASYAEGFGLCAAEGQACGLPTILTKFSSMLELAYDFQLQISPAQRCWNSLGCWQVIPSIEEIEKAITFAYYHRDVLDGVRTERGTFIASRYAMPVVSRDYWQPFLGRVEAELGGEMYREKAAD